MSTQNLSGCRQPSETDGVTGRDGDQTHYLWVCVAEGCTRDGYLDRELDAVLRNLVVAEGSTGTFWTALDNSCAELVFEATRVVVTKLTQMTEYNFDLILMSLHIFQLHCITKATIRNTMLP